MKKLLMSLSLTLAMSNAVFASTDTPVDFP